MIVIIIMLQGNYFSPFTHMVKDAPVRSANRCFDACNKSSHLQITSIVITHKRITLSSPRYGRWKVLVPSQIILVIAGIINAFSPNFAVYIVTRFVIGFFIPGIMVSTFVLASEFVGPRYRPLAGILLWGFFALGLIILGAQAYLIRKWKILTLVCTVPYIITFPMLK